MMSLNEIKRWAKGSDAPAAQFVRQGWRFVRYFEIPSISAIHGNIYRLHQGITGLIGWLARVLYWTPLFQSQLVKPAQRLYLYGGLPLITGPLDIEIGSDCRISAATTFSGRWSGHQQPRLVVGTNVGIGWQTTIAVGRNVILGDNVRIAGRSFLAGYPGHPIDAEKRAAGLPDTDDQIGDIVLEKDVWLGTGVIVSGGVTIGQGTIVASGSVVTTDLPPHCLAAGVPAKVIRPLAVSMDNVSHISGKAS